MIDPVEEAIFAGAVSALRKRAAVQREKAQSARWSEQDTHRRLAKMLSEIADEFEAGGRS